MTGHGRRMLGKNRHERGWKDGRWCRWQNNHGRLNLLRKKIIWRRMKAEVWRGGDTMRTGMAFDLSKFGSYKLNLKRFFWNFDRPIKMAFNLIRACATFGMRVIFFSPYHTSSLDLLLYFVSCGEERTAISPQVQLFFVLFNFFSFLF